MTHLSPFSPGTIEGESLKKLNSEEQSAILQNTPLYNEALFANEEVSRILDKGLSSTMNWITENIEENNKYAGMTKLQIEINGETKDIWLDNGNFRIDSSDWKIIENDEFWAVKFDPSWRVMEFIDGPEAWQQLFWSKARLDKELRRVWKRLPFMSDKYPEFLAIIEKVWIDEFRKVYPGVIQNSCLKGIQAIFWTETTHDKYYCTSVCPSKFWFQSFGWTGGWSVRAVKD